MRTKRKQRLVLNEKTLLPLSLVITFTAAAVWLTSVFAQVRTNGEKLKEVKENQKRYIDTVQRIDRRLSKIEGRLGIKSKED